MPDKLTKLTALHVTRVAFVPKGDNPGAHVPLWKAAPNLGDRLATALAHLSGETEKRDYSKEQRDAMAKDGRALPDGSFPIADEADLKNAISAYGRASDTAAAKRHIVKRAKALGKTDLLPDGWGVGKKAGGREEGQVDETPTRKDLPDDLPEKVTQYLDSLDKRVEEAATEIATLTKERDEAKAAADAKVEKAKDDGDVDPIAKAIEAETDPVRKAALVEIQKRDADRERQAEEDRKLTKAAQDKADKLEVEKADDQAIAKVAGWKHLPFKAEEVGPSIRKLRQADAELAVEIEKVLDRTNAIASEALKEFGAGDAVAGGEPLEKLNAMAKARAEKSDGKLTEAQAFDEVVQTPDGKVLYAEYQAAREEAIR